MFGNSEQKLKVIAVVSFVLGIIVSIVAASMLSKNPWGEVNVLLFLVILLVGCVASYIQALLLYAFADIIDYLKQIAYNTGEKSSEEAGGGYYNFLGNNPGSSSNQRLDLSYEDSENGWVCSGCGTYNNKSAFTCSKCGRTKY